MLKILNILLIAINVSICSFVYSQSPVIADSLDHSVNVPIEKKRNTLIQDDPVITMLDSLATQKYFTFSKFTSDRNKLNVHHFSEGFVPTYNYATYKERIDALDKQTPFDLVYNDEVKQFIDLYAVRKSKLTERIMGLSELYFPIFEQMLDKYKLPLELKYLAVIESALCPVAVSPAGAGGLWQFMYYTGRLYNLKVTSYVDERYDPYKATDAACRYLKYLYSLFHDWTLVIAAYNVGEGNLTRAIRRAGGETDFWKIKRFLPQETRSYVPAFIAVNYVLNHAAEHNIYPIAPIFLYHEVDTLKISQTLRFDQISEYLNIPYSDLVFLNPTYKHGVIPASADEPLVLRLPKKYIGTFINNELALYTYRTKQDIEKENIAKMRNKVFINGQKFEKYVVSSGENLQMVADEFGCSKDNIKKWNKLKRDKLRPNETLLILMKADSSMVRIDSTSVKNLVFADSVNKAKIEVPKLKQESVIVKTPIIQNVKHVVKSGESLGHIASKYGCSVNDIKKWNNFKNNFIHPNQSLIVKQTIIYQKQVVTKQQETKKTVTTDKAINKIKNDSLKSSKVDSDVVKGTKKVDDTNIANSTLQNKPIKFIYHTVQAGDSLWSISVKYKALSVEELKKINNIQGNSLVPGQKIKVGVSS